MEEQKLVQADQQQLQDDEQQELAIDGQEQQQEQTEEQKKESALLASIKAKGTNSVSLCSCTYQTEIFTHYSSKVFIL